MKQNMFVLMILLLAGILLAACSSTKKSTMTGEKDPSVETIMGQLSAGDWKLTNLETEMIPSNSKAVLSFLGGEKNIIAGSGGCNRLTGSIVNIDKNSIKFSPIAMTRMACFDETVMVTESKFVNVLGRVDTWSLVDGNLILGSGNNVLAKFRPIKHLSKEEMKLNANWELDYISGPKIAFDGLYPTKRPTLQFNLAESEVSGNSSCNGYGAKVTWQGTAMSFGDPIGTMMACPGEGEQLFYRTLKSVTSYQLNDDNSLSLLAGSNMVLRFKRK